MQVDINEKKVGVQSEKLEIIKKTDANEMVRKVKKQRSTEPFIVETPTKVISVDNEVRILPSSLPTSPLHTRTPYPSSGFDPRFSSGSTPTPLQVPLHAPLPAPLTSPLPTLLHEPLPIKIHVPLPVQKLIMFWLNIYHQYL